MTTYDIESREYKIICEVCGKTDRRFDINKWGDILCRNCIESSVSKVRKVLSETLWGFGEII